MGKQRKIEIHIPNPCTQDWEKMTPEGKGRFCKQCNKTIIDFSAFTDKELLDYFANAKQKICGIYNLDQLNRVISARQPSDTSIFRKALFGTALAASLAACDQNQTQATSPKKIGSFTHIAPFGKPSEVNNAHTISGWVCDSNTHHPLEGVIMNIFDKNGNEVDQTYSDSSGHFNFNVPASYINKTLSVRAYDSHYSEKIHVFENVQLPVGIIFTLVPAPPQIYTGKIMGDTIAIEAIDTNRRRKK